MDVRKLAVAATLVAGLGLSGCFSSATKGPGKDVMLAELRKEADALKHENEGQDTSLGVQTTWNVASVDVTEPAGKDAPWKGVIRFQIHTETRDGSKVQVDEIEKSFNYVYNTTLNKWIFEYKPS